MQLHTLIQVLALVDNASEADLWNIMAAQIAAANGMGTHILMHPTDVAKFRSLRKDTTVIIHSRGGYKIT